MVQPAGKRVTYAEYMAFTETAEQKYEYVDGQMYAMSGGTIVHGRLIGRLTALIAAAWADRPWVVLPAEVRVRIRAADMATYPDLHVVCTGVEADPDDPHAVINPTVIVEVLSASTEEHDRTTKFRAYRRLKSLREYVTVAQDERSIDVYRRDGRRWVIDTYEASETFRLESLDITLAVDTVYTDRLGTIV